MVKRFEELTIADDFMFGKVTADERVSRVLLETLLQRPVGELSEVTAQKELRRYKDGKYIRMDLYTIEDRSVIEAEMQNKGNQSVRSLSLGKRSRYYQSMIDTDFLDKGRPYNELPQSTIIFICTFDPFGMGRWRYTFRNVCVDGDDSGSKDGLPGGRDDLLELGDEAARIFFNCTSEGGEAPGDIQGFYEYVISGRVSTDATRIIDEAVQRARLNEDWRGEYMKELLHDHDVWADGQALGESIGEERGIAIGEERGIAIGEERGIAIGEERGISIGTGIGSGLVNELARLMNEAGRIEEFISSTSDPALQQRLMAEFGLTAGTPVGA